MNKHGLQFVKAAMMGLLITIGLGFIVALAVSLVAFVIGLIITPPSGHDITFTDRCYFSLGIGAAGFIAVAILCLRDIFKEHRYECSHPDIDYMFEKLVSNFKEKFPQITYEMEQEDWNAIKIVAKDKNVGDMTISVGWNDIILGIGQIFHLHFRFDYSQSEPEEAEDKALSAALSCAEDFFTGRVVLRIKFRRNKPVTARVVDPVNNKCLGWIASLGISSILSSLLFQKSEVRDFVWSGPYDAEKQR